MSTLGVPRSSPECRRIVRPPSSACALPHPAAVRCVEYSAFVHCCRVWLGSAAHCSRCIVHRHMLIRARLTRAGLHAPGALPQTTCQRTESRPSWRRTSRSRCRAWHASRATTRPAARLTNLPACNAPHVTCKSASTHVGCRTLHAAHRQPYGAPCLPCAGRRLCAACKALGADSLQSSHWAGWMPAQGS